MTVAVSCQKPTTPNSETTDPQQETPQTPDTPENPNTPDPETPDNSQTEGWKVEYLGTKTENGSTGEEFRVSGTGEDAYYFFVVYEGFLEQLENNLEYFFATAEQYYQQDLERQGAQSLLVKQDPCTLYYSELDGGNYEAYVVGMTEDGKHTGKWTTTSFTKEGPSFPEDLTSLTLMPDWGVTYLRTEEETSTPGVNWADVFSVQAPGAKWLEIMEVSDMMMGYLYGSVLDFVNALQYTYYDRYYKDFHGLESSFFYTDGGREWRAEHVDGTNKYYLVEFDDNWHCTGRYGVSEIDIPELEYYY